MKNLAFDLQRFVKQSEQSVHSGNTIFLKVNGYIIGRAQSLDGRRSFGTEGVYEIGSIMPQEHVNNRYEGTVSLERFLIRKSDLAKAGMAALGEEILTRDIIDIEVISKYDLNGSESGGEVVRVYRGCTCVDYSETFRVGAISGENATFQYLSCDRGEDSENAEFGYGTSGSTYYGSTYQGLNSGTSVSSITGTGLSARLEYANNLAAQSTTQGGNGNDTLNGNGNSTVNGGNGNSTVNGGNG